MEDITQSVYGGMFDSTSVTETAGGFPRGDKAVDAEFFAKMISCFYKSGVFGSDSFTMEPNGGLTVKINPGVAWIHGYMAWLKEATSVTLEAGCTCLIALRLNIPAGEFNIVATTDTEGMPCDEDGIAELVLAEITIPSYTTMVTQAMITDKRSDATMCGFVTSALDSLGSVASAEDADNLGGLAADAYLLKAGGVMTGNLSAAHDATGRTVVRNIGYGTALPETLPDGDIFILVSGS